MSNVSPLPGIPMRRVTTVRTTSRVASHCWLLRAARIAHGDAVLDRMAAETQLALARAVRPLAAGAPSVRLEQIDGLFSTAVLSNRRRQMLSEGKHTNSKQMPWLTRRASMRVPANARSDGLASACRRQPRPCRERRHACVAKSRSVRGVRGFVPSFARANPSIERTNNGKPLFAAHVERWASRE